MSVIAKMMLRDVREFGTGAFAELGCVAENEMMAAYATSDEDKLFSRYSPWGEIRLHERSGWAVFRKEDQHVAASNPPVAFFAMLLDEDEAAEHHTAGFGGASAFLKVACYSKTKFAQDGSRVELREVGGWAKSAEEQYRTRAGVVEKLSWKMHVDNPPAEAQFVPGKVYWLAFYDAAKFDKHQAIAAAHGHTTELA